MTIKIYKHMDMSTT